MTKAARFQELLRSPRLEFLLEAHNGLSARVVEEAGFAGIWASGLALSAQFGVRDNNEASWTQVLEMLEFMADATSIPILLDGDTGYGNFNNVRRLVKKLEQRGIAALCIEDKLFPKTNSFLDGETQPLAEVEEFCGKIQAAKDVADDDFAVVARVEALIAGWGLAEALRRAEAYVDAGADAILIHSARSTADEVLAFKSEWGARAPVVIVPTKYARTPTRIFEEAGFSLAIWANQLLRSSLQAMQRTAREIQRERSAAAVESEIAPLAEVFRIQGADELREAETRFLPRAGKARAVVLAAGRGGELGRLTEDRPKTMIPVQGQPLLAHIVSAFKSAGVHRISVVRGYAKEKVDLPGLALVDNDDFETTGELHSLALALESFDEAEGDVIVCYGDVLFRRHVLELLHETEADLAIAVDTDWKESANMGRHADYVECSEPPSRRAFGERVTLRRMSADLREEERHGEWMGLLKLAPAAVPPVRAEIARLLGRKGNERAQLATLMNALASAGRTIQVAYTTGNWLDVDSLYDVIDAERFA